MAKERPVEISVATVFDGKKEGRQAFIELILYKRRAFVHDSKIDAGLSDKYNDSKVFSDVRVG